MLRIVSVFTDIEAFKAFSSFKTTESQKDSFLQISKTKKRHLGIVRKLSLFKGRKRVKTVTL